jgi:8-oxo-dGTP pyrophosphatase MutT (NUDIX family)
MNKITYKNKFFKIFSNDGYFEISPNSRDVMILPIVDKKSFLLIRSRRKFIKKNLLEFPAGGFDIKKETPLEGAKREFEEETGIKVKKKNKIFKIAKIYQMPNRIRDLVFVYGIYITSDQVNIKYSSEETHSIEVKSFKKTINLIKKNKIKTSVALAALLNFFISIKKL